MTSVLTGRYAMLKRTAGYSDLLFTFRGLPRRPVWVGWLTAAVFAQRFPEHYRLTQPRGDFPRQGEILQGIYKEDFHVNPQHDIGIVP